MSEAKVHISVEQRIVIKFLMKEGCKLLEICSSLKTQYGEKTPIMVRTVTASMHPFGRTGE